MTKRKTPRRQPGRTTKRTFDTTKSKRKHSERQRSGERESSVTNVTNVTQSPQTGGGRPPRQSTQLQRLLAIAQGITLFRSTEGEPYATVPRSGHRENWPVRSRQFRHWLMLAYHRTHSEIPGRDAVDDAIDQLEGRALLEGPERRIHVRAAEHEGKIYIDLANDAWEAIEVDRNGWRVVAKPPVAFVRHSGTQPLPIPESGGTIEELRQFTNFESEDDFVLFVSFMLAALWPRGPYPVLVLRGEQGSAKSTSADIVQKLTDPVAGARRATPRSEHDLAIGAHNGWLLAFDNTSALAPWLSDALCRLATGGGLRTRKLYTDAEEQIFDFQRPVLLNGIDDIVTRSDLADRAIILDLPPIDSCDRRPEREFWREFAAAWPRIFGVLLDGVSAAHRNLDEVQLQNLPRLADFARLATAAENGFGWEPGTFLRAYEANQEQARLSAIDRSPLAARIQALMLDTGTWRGNASQLLQVLRAQEDRGVGGPLPATARGLSDELRRLAPNLRAIGIEVERIAHARTIVLRRESEDIVTNVTNVTPRGSPEKGLDGGGADASDGTPQSPLGPGHSIQPDGSSESRPSGPAPEISR